MPYDPGNPIPGNPQGGNGGSGPPQDGELNFDLISIGQIGRWDGAAWEWFDVPNDGGGGGGSEYHPPEWRPGELDLLYKQFFADTANSNLDREAAKYGPDLSYKLGIKQLALERRGQDLDNQLGIKQLAEQKREADLQHALGLKQIEMQKYEAEIDKELGLEGLKVDWARLGLEGKLGEGQLAELVRSNKAGEAATERGLALDRARAAVDAYLQGSAQADSRRQASFDAKRSILPMMVNPNQQYFAGSEPGGILATMAQRFGLPHSPVSIQHTTMNPDALARPPTDEQIGPGVLGLLGGLGA